ncbi:MAG: hypothetical protein MJ250_07690 [Alphaproteobacteria bacterium]|nr:hypothetical protein [Alphaproteobacteria bacterium]
MSFSFGGIAGGIIKLAFTTTDTLQKGVCTAAENIVHDEDLKQKIKSKSNIISNAVQEISQPVSQFAEKAIDGTILIAGELAGNAAKTTCVVCGASKEFTDKAEKCAKIVGKAAVGYAIGAEAVSLIASGLAGSSSASAITSGLSTLGGGSIATGGGGMIAGIHASNLIVGTSMLVGANTKPPEYSNSEKTITKKEEILIENNNMDEK